MELGGSFSHLQAKSLGLNPRDCFKRVLKLPLTRIRLCVYWPDIQPKPEQWHFAELQWQLHQAQAANKQVTLVCGQKSPRWPEFHVPTWLDSPVSHDPSPLYQYLKKLVTQVRRFDCITAWQIENEPFDPSGPNLQVIDPALFAAEVRLVRSLDRRAIVSTLWGNTLLTRNSIELLMPLVDRIGIDVYPTISTQLPSPLPRYYNQWLPNWWMRAKIRQSKKPIYCAELQAEPWEASQALFLSKQQQSMSPAQLRKNIVFIQSLGIEQVDCWGTEYWQYAQKEFSHDYGAVISQFLRQQTTA